MLPAAAAAQRHGGTLLTVSVSNKLNRDEAGAAPAAAALAFGELMAAGARAALSAGGGAAEKAVPEAARDVLVACADLAVTRHRVTAVPDELEPGPDLGHGGLLIASDMLELIVTWDADGWPGGLTPLPLAYASPSAFDRDDEPAVLEAACVLITLAHPTTGPSPAPGTSP